MVTIDDEKKGFYITTSIPYVNAPPHIGHALEFVQADIIARYRRLKGERVFLLTGADENSLKNVKAAEDQKTTTRELVDRNAALFKLLADRISLSYDRFARSSVKDEHQPGVWKLWNLVGKSGDIYKKAYKGLYCVACELFYKETELAGGLCPVHKTKPETVEEENYFFKLSKYQEKLNELITNGTIDILPDNRKNEMLGIIKEGLEDFSISRSSARARGWGIPVPNDESQILYVWMDALALYITGIGYGTDENAFNNWWPADVHAIGKDIVKFHAIYWPAFLLSANMALPKRIFIHGFLTIEGQKMSKTTGNVVNPITLLEKYSADEIRYYLIRDIPTFDDGDFSESALKDRINKELLGDLGNLVNRVLTLAENSGLEKFTGGNELEASLNIQEIKKRMEEMELHAALELIMEFVRHCNKYVNDKKPWTLKGSELEEALYNLLESLRVISILLYPFIPETSERISEKLGTDRSLRAALINCKFRDKFNDKITKGDLLFKKVE